MLSRLNCCSCIEIEFGALSPLIVPLVLAVSSNSTPTSPPIPPLNSLGGPRSCIPIAYSSDHYVTTRTGHWLTESSIPPKAHPPTPPPLANTYEISLSSGCPPFPSISSLSIRPVHPPIDLLLLFPIYSRCLINISNCFQGSFKCEPNLLVSLNISH